MLSLSETAAAWSAEHVAELCGGRLVGESRGVAASISTDSRTIEPGALFVALRGERFDGHEHLPGAVKAGAAGLLVEAAPELAAPESGAESPGAFVVVVEDTRRALLDLAAAWRRELGTKVIGVTGTCGKTSVKDMLAHATSVERSVVAAERSFNNEIGVPLTLLRARASTELCVVEIGTNAPGEIATLGRVAAPDVAVITKVGRGHLEGLGDVAGVLEEKGSLLDALSDDGVAVLGADDDSFAPLKARAGKRRVIAFGLRSRANFCAEGIRPTSHGLVFELRVDGESRGGVELPRQGMHDVANALAAFAAANAVGVPLDEMRERLASLPPVARRLEAKETARGVRILDDSYNANPESLLAALAVLDRGAARRRVLVLGDMLELGENSSRIHQDIGAQLVGRIDLLVSVGPLAAECADAFVARDGIALRFDDVDQLIAELGGLVAADDLVLFKASRRVALDRAVDWLVAAH